MVSLIPSEKVSEEEKIQRKEYLRKWNLQHKEEQARKKREYRLKHLEITKKRDRDYYYKNRDRILKYKKKNDNRPRKGNKNWREIIERVKQELVHYASKGIRPTLRTMHYRLFSLGIISNTKSDYTGLSKKTTAAREQRKTNVYGSKGKIKAEYYPRLPIDCFADDTRKATRYPSELDRWKPEDLIQDKIYQLKDLETNYRQIIPRWFNQPHYVEIWTEKKAMVETFKELVRGREVDIVPLGGFHSVPYLWNNSEILNKIQNLGYEDEHGNKNKKQIHILYFGDFDPTGEVIEQVIRKRLSYYGTQDIDFQRIAITYEQMIEFDLPQKLDPRTYKKIDENDSNARRFKNKYGDLYQVEIDALPALKPDEFSQMVINSIDQYYNYDIYEKVVKNHSFEKIHELIKQNIQRTFDLH